MTVQILLLEHDDVETLYPFSTTHCSWELRAGAFTIAERWRESVAPSHVTVTSHRDLHLASFMERHPGLPEYERMPTLFISGHVLISPSVMRQIVAACEHAAGPILVFCSGHPVGAYLPDPPVTTAEAAAAIEAIDVATATSIEVMGHIINRPWQILDRIDDAITWDAELVQRHVAASARVHSTAVLDAAHGPVLVMDGAEVGAFAVLVGPVVVGPACTVKQHSSIRGTVLGPHCKVAGEISATVIHGYSNKQHDGFLGHSYLCEWVNLGAGTTTSNLKNTYGHVRMELPWGEEDSQRMFLGLMMGDHSKSAIGTQFSTGTCCGVSSNVVSEGFPPKHIASFTWLTGHDAEPFDIDKAVHIARTVMARRHVDLGPATEALLRHVHYRTHA